MEHPPCRRERKPQAQPRAPWAEAACAVLLCAAPLAMAGRPLSSDDASTADAGTCQAEVWSGRDTAARSMVVAPACGVAAGLELGADHTRFSPRGTQPDQAGLTLKWAPAAWQTSSVAGELNFGLKLSGSWVNAAGASWQHAQTSALLLATWKAGETIAMHANLGAARDRASRSQGTLLNLAVVLTPLDSLLLFAEVQGNDKREVFGRTVASVGTRWWLVKDTLGLDLSASREVGAGAGKRWTFGLGWYGIGS